MRADGKKTLFKNCVSFSRPAESLSKIPKFRRKKKAKTFFGQAKTKLVRKKSKTSLFHNFISEFFVLVRFPCLPFTYFICILLSQNMDQGFQGPGSICLQIRELETPKKIRSIRKILKIRKICAQVCRVPVSPHAPLHRIRNTSKIRNLRRKMNALSGIPKIYA